MYYLKIGMRCIIIDSRCPFRSPVGCYGQRLAASIQIRSRSDVDTDQSSSGSNDWRGRTRRLAPRLGPDGLPAWWVRGDSVLRRTCWIRLGWSRRRRSHSYVLHVLNVIWIGVAERSHVLHVRDSLATPQVGRDSKSGPHEVAVAATGS